MQFAISTLSRGPTATRAGYLAMAEAADRLGYGFVSVNDHVVVPGDVASTYPYSEDGTWAAADEGFCLEQLSLLSFLAACTKRVRLLTSVMVVPHRHPILAAKMIATADVLSEGRVTVGVGAGWMREEFDVLGREFATQMEAMFAADLAESKQITLKQWRRRSLLTRIKERVARLGEYWL